MKKYFWLVVILAVGTFLRFYHNTDISLWHDEAFSALLIRYPWQEMMYRIGLDVHPPMYYIGLRLWHYLFGDSLLALRSFTVFFGVLTVWATWAFARIAFKSEKIALWGAFLVAINPFVLKNATEARMYGMGAFFAVLAAYFITKALRAQNEYYKDARLNMPHLPKDNKLHRSLLLNYLGFTLSIIVLIYTHYYLLFTAAALCFYALVYHLFHHRFNLKRYYLLVASYFLIAISYLPWLKTFLFQYHQVGAGYWIPPMDKWSIPTTLWQLIIGFGYDISKTGTQRLIIALTLVVLFILIRFLQKTQAFEKWLVLLCILAPFAGATLFFVMAKLKGGNSSVFLDRYFLYTSASFSIAIAAWLAELRAKAVGVIIMALYAAANILAFGLYWKDVDIAHKPGMHGAARLLGTNVEPDHHVLVGTSFEFFNYKYYDYTYYPVPTRPLLYTGGTRHASEISHFAGSAILTDADLQPEWTDGVNKGDIVWLLWTTAFGSGKPTNIPANWTQIDERGFADVRPYLGTWVVVTEYRVD